VVQEWTVILLKNDNRTWILLLYDQEKNPSFFQPTYRTYYIMQKQHGFNIAVDVINVRLLIGDEIDDYVIKHISNNIHKYVYVYVVPQERAIRHQLRMLFKARTGKDVHIKLYSKMVESVTRRLGWK